MSFANRVALISGAASGLGRELALLLGAEGAAVAGLDLQARGLEQLTHDLPSGKVATTIVDVADGPAVAQAVTQLEQRLGPIDLLLACAGVGYETSACNFQAADLEKVIRVNLIGVSNCIAAVLPGMLQRRSGHLVAISSLASYRGMPLMAGYCASKAGVNALLDALRVELRGQGIAVTTICPGWVRTPMTEQVRIPKPGLMEPTEAARLILEAVRRRRTFFAFPNRLAWRIALLRWLPPGISDWLLWRMYGKLKN